VATKPRQVTLSNRADKAVKSASPTLQEVLKEAIQEIAANPLGGIPLKGEFKGLRRFRVSNYRIVYHFTDTTVEIVNVADRKDAYR